MHFVAHELSTKCALYLNISSRKFWHSPTSYISSNDRGQLASWDRSWRWDGIVKELRSAVSVQQWTHFHWRWCTVLTRVVTWSCTWSAVRRRLIQPVSWRCYVLSLLDGIGMNCKVDTDTGRWASKRTTQTHTHTRLLQWLFSRWPGSASGLA